MAEFKDSSLWLKIAFLMVTIGQLADWFAFSTGMGDSSSGVEAMLIIGLLCFITALILALCLVFLDEVKGKKPALICFVIFAMVAGVATVIGVAIWGGNRNRGNNRLPAYSTALGVLAGLLAILGAIFGILDLAGVKAK